VTQHGVGFALVVVLSGCRGEAPDATTCRCTPASSSVDVLAELRHHVELVDRHANGRDIKMVDDEIRLAVGRSCQPCGDWVGDRLTLDDMFPMARLRDATRATCLGLVLRDGTIAYGDARPTACRR
jgi:hypothetical protein